jgi:predicted nucleic acid-binding protein
MNGRSKGNKVLLTSLDALFWGDEKFFSIRYLGEIDFKKIVEIMKKYTSSSKVISFPDASLVHVAREKDIDKIISFDQHFDGILTREPYI